MFKLSKIQHLLIFLVLDSQQSPTDLMEPSKRILQKKSLESSGLANIKLATKNLKPSV